MKLPYFASFHDESCFVFNNDSYLDVTQHRVIFVEAYFPSDNASFFVDPDSLSNLRRLTEHEHAELITFLLTNNH